MLLFVINDGGYHWTLLVNNEMYNHYLSIILYLIYITGTWHETAEYRVLWFKPKIWQMLSSIGSVSNNIISKYYVSSKSANEMFLQMAGLI